MIFFNLSSRIIIIVNNRIEGLRRYFLLYNTDDANCGTSSISNHAQCDDSWRSKNVVGGWEVTANELPYQVKLYLVMQ